MKRFLSAFLVLLLLFGGARPVSATAPTERWAIGIQRIGALVATENTPIAVERALLTFDLQEFPKETYENEAEFLAYSGKVTTEYTLYNPTDTTITTQFLLPLGALPQYAVFNSAPTANPSTPPDLQEYDILVNGEAVEKQISDISPDDEAYAYTDPQFNSYDSKYWYAYEIEIPVGQRVVHTVIAPIYPSIELFYEPNAYLYTYSFSHGNAWSSHGPLEIVVNTPAFVSAGSAFPFEKTDTGYKLTLEGLPDGALSFTICESEEPALEDEGFNWGWLILLIYPFFLIAEAFEAIGEFFTNLFQNLF